MDKYIPKPIDTSDIEIDKSLVDLQEQLSKNIHEVWSKGRIDDGWMYGIKRDDNKKEHPCLVNYDELPESEKNYDRNSAVETLKFILNLGYTITPPNKIVLPESEQLIVNQQLNSIINSKLLLPELISLWKERNKSIWKSEPEIYYQLGLCFLKLGEPLLSYDVFSEGLEFLSANKNTSDSNQKSYIRMSQQQALSLAETGAVREASTILKALTSSSEYVDSETLGLLGRTYKEMGLSEGVKDDERREYLKHSYNSYFTAYETALKNSKNNDAYYNGINAATIALFLGDTTKSIELAEHVTEICTQIIAEAEHDAVNVMYWVYATLGEAALLLNNLESAKSFYESAILIIGEDMRGKNSMHKQVEKILGYKNVNADIFDELFKKPTVLVFSGHMIDGPESNEPRFPESAEDYVRKEIKNELSKYDVCIAYSSAACGADIIFLEEVVKKGGEINIILPYDIENFKETSVNVVSNGDWGARLDVLIADASQVTVLAQINNDSNGPAYDFTNRYILGSAIARAKIINSEVEYMAIWDGIENNNIGGTASVMKLWSGKADNVTVIDPVNGAHEFKTNSTNTKLALLEYKTNNNGADVSYYNYLPLLFADVKGYSKLNENQLVTFSTVFLKYISQVFDKYNDGVFIKRTQGDGLFVVFNSINIAADCANDIKNVIAVTQWQDFGLPEDLTIRISLDAGPVYSYIEPVTKNLEVCGDYVNRAARIEPITPPGHIYASKSFVAMANVENITNFNFAYAGQIVLPKGHGIIPAYHMYKNKNI